MANIFDVSAYILARCNSMTTMKLQKLAFYAQAEMLSKHGRPLFNEDFQAWRGGPVCVDLYRQHRGMFIIRKGELPSGNPSILNGEERFVVDAVCEKLNGMTGNELSRKTHSEQPWIAARNGMPASAVCNTVIDKQAMMDYYAMNPVI